MMRLFTSLALVSLLGVAAAAWQSRTDDDVLDMPPLHGEAVAFDHARGRLVVVGGRTPTESLAGTWEWDTRRWRRAIGPADSPTPRGGAAIGYDPVGRRMMLFGGMTGSPPQLQCDTWTLDNGAWARSTQTPCITERIRNATLVFDTRARRMLLVDGPAIAGEEPRPLRLWHRGGDSWIRVETQGPRRTGLGAVAYDSARGVLVVPVLFGGPDSGTWEWDGTTWTHMQATPPVPRQTFALTYDPGRRTVVLAGGQGTHGGPYFDDVWTWNGARWDQLLATGPRPPGRGGATLTSDPSNNRLLYFGGYNEALLNDLWALRGNVWTKLSPSAVQKSARLSRVMGASAGDSNNNQTSCMAAGNGNGTIDSGVELFGSATPQPLSSTSGVPYAVH